MTATFDEHEGKTTLTLRQEGVPVIAEREGAVAGWDESFDRLAEYVGGNL